MTPGTLDIARGRYVGADAMPGKTYVAEATDRPGYSVVAYEGFSLKADFDSDGVVIRDTETGIFGVGESPLDALRDFERAAEEHLDVLERQAGLSADLERQREYLRRRLSR